MKVNKDFCKFEKVLGFVTSLYWRAYYRFNNWMMEIKSKYQGGLLFLGLIACVVASWGFSLKLNRAFQQFFIPVRLSELHTLFITLGTALITVTAIAFSFIMFAMQVNVERMPYGLFKKLSSDSKLLTYFLVIFILSLLVSFLSIITTENLAGTALLIGGWSIFFIAFCLLATYKRALRLINPTEQLKLIYVDTRKHLITWSKGASRLSPSIKIKNEDEKSDNDEFNANYDLKRLSYFSYFPQWTDNVQRAVQYAFSLASYHASQGDYESSGMAMNTIIGINSEYIKAKGKTFIADSPLLNTNLSSDNVINGTLENFRLYFEKAIARGDEQQITQGFKSLKKLCFLYLNIDYPTELASKTHALLAISYLTDAIESTLPRGLVDVLMSGIRIMGQIAFEIIKQNDIKPVATLSEKISVISSVCMINPKMRPVAYIGVEQLAKIEFYLLKSECKDIAYLISKVHSDLVFVAKSVLAVEDPPLSQTHSHALSYYYSVTSYETFSFWLTTFTNAILKENKKDDFIREIIFHISQWSENLYRTEKELLLSAVDKKSAFTFDIIYWIVRVTKILLAVSTSDSCREYDRDSLIKNARWLIHVISWIPDNSEAVGFVENYDLTNQLFELTFEAKKRRNFEFALEVKALLLTWTFKIGQYGSRWSMLQALFGLVCINLLFDLNDSVLLTEINDKLDKYQLDNQLKQFIAAELKKKVNQADFNKHPSNAIDGALEKVNQKKLKKLLLELSEGFNSVISHESTLA